MKWSWKIARLAGIDVYLHFTFLLLIVWIGLGYWQLEGTPEAVVSGIGFILALFFCVLLHELGHALTARHYDIRTRNIVLLPIGGIASIERMPEDPGQEIKIALAGPAVSFGIALLLWLALKAGGGLVPLEEINVSGGSDFFVQRLMLVNLMLGAFNLLPALPMDGGRVFRALFTIRFGKLRATRIAAGVAQFLAVLLALIGLHYNLLLVIIAVFIWVGAVSESGLASASSALAGITARRAMLTDFAVLEPQESLGRAVELTLSGSQKDFPVVSDRKVVGVLRQVDLLRGLHDHGKLCRVDQVMQREVPIMDIGQSLEHVLEDMQTADSSLLAVMEEGRLAGVIDIDNVTEMLKIDKALKDYEGTRW